MRNSNFVIKRLNSVNSATYRPTAYSAGEFYASDAFRKIFGNENSNFPFGNEYKAGGCILGARKFIAILFSLLNILLSEVHIKKIIFVFTVFQFCYINRYFINIFIWRHFKFAFRATAMYQNFYSRH